MTHTVEQALQVRAAVRRTKKVLQVGPQATGSDGYWQAHAAIKAGRIGKMTWAQGSYNRNARVCLFNEHQKVDPSAGPDKTGEDFIDWDQDIFKLIATREPSNFSQMLPPREGGQRAPQQVRGAVRGLTAKSCRGLVRITSSGAAFCGPLRREQKAPPPASSGEAQKAENHRAAGCFQKLQQN